MVHASLCKRRNSNQEDVAVQEEYETYDRRIPQPHTLQAQQGI